MGLKNGIESYLGGLLAYLKQDPEDPNFKETPDRIYRTIRDTLLPDHIVGQQLSAVLEKAFPSPYNGIILAQNIKTHSYCPHHLLPVEYNINIGYIPNEETKIVLGISKLARISDILSKRLVLQETLTYDIADALASIGPAGVVVQIAGEHSCMKIRGVKQNSIVKTQCIAGVFETDNKALSELMSMLR